MDLANLALLLNSVVFFIIGLSLFILIIKVANFVETVGSSMFQIKNNNQEQKEEQKEE